MKVALFGASGKIGTRALALLRERGHEVRALIHRTPLPEAFGKLVEPAKSLLMTPDEVAANRGAWVAEWRAAMSR